MSFDPTATTIPEDLLRNNLADTQTWRAFVANPLADWATVAPLIAAGGIAAGEAASRIQYAFLQEEADHPDYVDRPRISIRQLDDDAYTREGGYTYAGVLLVDVELRIPTALIGRHGLAVRDGRYKLYSLALELLSVPPQAGRLSIARLEMGPVGLSPPTEDGERSRFVVGDFIVRFD